MVFPRRIQIAQDFGLVNVEPAAIACAETGLPFFAACALLQKESGGRNVFGHDAAGTLSGYPGEVTADTYAVFRWLVIDQGGKSNGVGPTQITWAGVVRPDGTRDGGFFTAMEDRGLRPWDPIDNMTFGFGILAWVYEEEDHSWVRAGTRYNGKATYGQDLLAKCAEWHDRLGVRGPLEP